MIPRSPPLPPGLLTRPIAHRGLHGPGVAENSLSAFRAAIAEGFAIEMDIQPASDDTPLVFHDDDVFRLTGAQGRISDLTAAEAGALHLGDTEDRIPTLAEVLAEVAGQTPLLIEIKDTDGALGADVGHLPVTVANLLADYSGEVAVMSFNPYSVAAFRAAAPGVAAGLTTCSFAPEDWPTVEPARLARLAEIPNFAQVGAAFVSHDHRDLHSRPVDALASRGVPILCWTIRSADQETAARRVAANITFEGYSPR